MKSKKKRIIVGPTVVKVEKAGIVSSVAVLGLEDDPEVVKTKAEELYQSIKPLVAWRSWVQHRRYVAFQRRWAAVILAIHPGPWYPGPRPDIISKKPWKQATHVEFLLLLPHGVTARVLRQQEKGPKNEY